MRGNDKQIMTLAEAVISGVVQGVTEFLPISSSGHLVLLHRYFRISEPSIFFDICLHVGTLAAIILYFKGDILSIIRERKTAWVSCIIIGTIPAVIAALFFEEKILSSFADVKKVAFMLIATALVLFAGQAAFRVRDMRNENPTLLSSLFVGIAQAFALLAGVSRSGVTISAGLWGGMKAETAFRFSFLLSVPVIIGAVLYRGLKRVAGGAVLMDNPANYIAGALTAFVVGLAGLFVLLKAVRTKRLYIFGIYCLFLGIMGIFYE